MAASPLGNATNGTCSAGGTYQALTSLGGTCLCREGFSGRDCSQYNPARVYLDLATHIVQSIALALVLGYATIKIHDLRQQGRLRASLALAALLLNVVASIAQGVWSWLPPGTVPVSDETLYVVAVTEIVLAYSPTVLLYASTNLFVGFWFEALTRNLPPRQQELCTIRLVVGSSFAIMLLAIAGMVTVLVNLALLPVAIGLIFAPLAVGVLITTGITIRIGRIQSPAMNPSTLQKRRWVLSRFIAICVCWNGAVLAIILALVVGSSASYVFSATFALLECAISIFLLLVSDFRGHALRRQLCAGREEARASAVSVPGPMSATTQTSAASSTTATDTPTSARVDTPTSDRVDTPTSDRVDTPTSTHEKTPVKIKEST
jgi:hypothetical protein